MGAAAGVEIVVDGGGRWGFGHIGRCLAIYEELDVPAVFCVSDPIAEEHLRSRGVEIAKPGSASVVLLDRVEPTKDETVRSIQREGRRVCLLDDRGSGRQSAELVVDPPTGAEWPSAGGKRLAGFDHVLIRGEIRAAAGTPPAGHVLVTMGGSDPLGLTTPVARALDSAGAPTLTVLGPGYSGPFPKGRVLHEQSGWPSALAGATLVVGAFGHTLLEAAHLGVPAVAVPRPEQRQNAASFAGHGTMTVVDARPEDIPERVTELVFELLGNRVRRQAMSERGQELVDGQGATRVARALEAL